jgi:uncharacterized membrane protein (UPF0127 family)
MKKIITALCALCLLGTACTSKAPYKPSPASMSDSFYNKKITVGKQGLWVFIADTEELLKQGLSGREKLTDTQGMMFNFKNTSYAKPGFWMKDMKFNLDLIWIKNNIIIGITKNVPAPKTKDEKLPVYYPPSPIDTALEVNAGWSDAHNVTIGTKIINDK